jgi:hypothetical protein
VAPVSVRVRAEGLVHYARMVSTVMLLLVLLAVAPALACRVAFVGLVLQTVARMTRGLLRSVCWPIIGACVRALRKSATNTVSIIDPAVAMARFGYKTTVSRLRPELNLLRQFSQRACRNQSGKCACGQLARRRECSKNEMNRVVLENNREVHAP